jgi:hypothetical protein
MSVKIRKTGNSSIAKIHAIFISISTLKKEKGLPLKRKFSIRILVRRLSSHKEKKKFRENWKMNKKIMRQRQLNIRLWRM